MTTLRIGLSLAFALLLMNTELEAQKSDTGHSRIQVAVNVPPQLPSLDSGDVSYYQDRENALNIYEVLAQQNRLPFRKFSAGALNLGFINSPVWIRLTLQNTSKKNLERILEIAYPLLDKITLYEVPPTPSRRLNKRERRPNYIRVRVGGRHYPFQRRKIANRHFVYSLQIPGESERVYFLRITSQSSINLHLRLWRRLDFINHDHYAQYAFGLYYGLIAVMIVYNLFLFFSVRDISYLHYVGTLVFFHAFFHLAINGILSEYISTGYLLGIRETIALFISWGIAFALFFCRSFLNTKVYLPFLDRVIKGLVILVLISGCMFFAVNFQSVIQVLAVLGLIALSLILYAGVAVWRTGYKPAFYYILAWIALIIGGFIFSLKIWGFVPGNIITVYGMQIGAALEAILLSFALGARFNTLLKEKLKAQQEAQEKERQVDISRDELFNHLHNTEKLKDEIFAIEETDGSLESLLKKILSTLKELLKFDRGFVVILDRDENFHVNSLGIFPMKLQSMISGEVFRNRLMRVPADLFPYLDNIFLLPLFKEQLIKLPDETRKKYKDHLEILERFSGDLSQADLQVCIPLSFRKEIFGYVLFGNDRGYTEFGGSEYILLSSFRSSMALAVRNAILYEKIKTLKGQAEEKVKKLSDYVGGMGEVIKHRIQDKTLVFASEPMNDLFARAQRYAEQSQQPILVTGPTGTGKEVLAQTIHEIGCGESAPFIAVNCAAIPAGLWESDIFGHEKGAFTDAKKNQPGRVEQAAGGTLFFDEIGEMPLEMQPKLLRLLQERKFNRVGGSHTQVADCRFIFATNRDLYEEQKLGRFREDLYYRINVLELKVPPLGDRTADIPILVNYFVGKYSAELKTEIASIDSNAMSILTGHSWPGNIRELENCMIHAVIHAQSDTIRPEDLPAQLYQTPRDENGKVFTPRAHITPGSDRSFDEIIKDYSRAVLIQAIEANQGDKIQAAKMLGIKRATFYYKIKELGIK